MDGALGGPNGSRSTRLAHVSIPVIPAAMSPASRSAAEALGRVMPGEQQADPRGFRFGCGVEPSSPVRNRSHPRRKRSLQKLAARPTHNSHAAPTRSPGDRLQITISQLTANVSDKLGKRQRLGQIPNASCPATQRAFQLVDIHRRLFVGCASYNAFAAGRGSVRNR